MNSCRNLPKLYFVQTQYGFNSVGLILIYVADVWNKLKVSNFLFSFKLRSGTWKPDFQDDKIFCRNLIWSQMAGFWDFPSEMWWWMIGRIFLLVSTLVKCWNIFFSKKKKYSFVPKSMCHRESFYAWKSKRTQFVYHICFFRQNKLVKDVCWSRCPKGAIFLDATENFVKSPTLNCMLRMYAQQALWRLSAFVIDAKKVQTSAVDDVGRCVLTEFDLFEFSVDFEWLICDELRQ